MVFQNWSVCLTMGSRENNIKQNHHFVIMSLFVIICHNKLRLESSPEQGFTERCV